MIYRICMNYLIVKNIMITVYAQVMNVVRTATAGKLQRS